MPFCGNMHDISSALSRGTTHVNNRSVIGDADIIKRIEMLDVIGRENSLKFVILQCSN